MAKGKKYKNKVSGKIYARRFRYTDGDLLQIKQGEQAILLSENRIEDLKYHIEVGDERKLYFFGPPNNNSIFNVRKKGGSCTITDSSSMVDIEIYFLKEIFRDWEYDRI